MKIVANDPRLYNPIYIPLHHDKRRIKILYGGRGSGKSHAAAQLVLMETVSRAYSKFILARQYHKDIKKSQFEEIIQEIKRWGLMDYFKVNRSASDMSITFKKNGNSIVTVGLEKPDAAKSIKDPTGAWYEEADQINYDAWRNTSMSIRTNRPGVKLTEILTFNPVHENCWINKEFFPQDRVYEKEDGSHNYLVGPRHNTLILHTTYKNNRFLPDDYYYDQILPLKKSNPDLYRVDALGNWGRITTGLAFPDIESCKPEEVPEGLEVIYGIDWGWDPDPTSVVKISKAGNTLYLEEVLRDNRVTTSDFFDRHAPEIWESRYSYTYTDVGRPDALEEADNRGYNFIQADKSRGTREASIVTLQSYKLVIVENGEHEHILREFQNYKRKRDRYGNYISEWQDGYDHAVDAAKMAVYTHTKDHWRVPEANFFGGSSTKKHIDNSGGDNGPSWLHGF